MAKFIFDFLSPLSHFPGFYVLQGNYDNNEDNEDYPDICSAYPFCIWNRCDVDAINAARTKWDIPNEEEKMQQSSDNHFTPRIHV